MVRAEWRGSLIFGSLILLFFNTAYSEEELVIIEKPDISLEGPLEIPVASRGEPRLGRWSSQWGLAFMRKQFTFVAENTQPVDSSFYGGFYARSLNFTWVSISGDIGLYSGSKQEKLAGEDSNVGLQQSLSNQSLVDLGVNIYLNSFASWGVRPYAGGGIYMQSYRYVIDEASTQTKQFTLNSSFIRAGLALDIGKIDRNTALDMWYDYGIYRSSLILEGKQYASLEPSIEPRFELYSALVFEY